MLSNSIAHSGPLTLEVVAGMTGGTEGLTPMIASIPAIIIGPQGLERDGLVGILQQNGYLILNSIENISDLRSECQPSLVILSEFCQEQIAASVIPLLQARFPMARIVVLTDEANSSASRYLLEMGIHACLNRSAQPVALIKSLNVVMGGNIVISIEAASHLNGGGNGLRKPPIIRFANHADTSPAAVSDLSNREIEILACLSAGHSNKSIARELMISEATVKIHVKSVLRKINVRNRTQAAVWVSKFGVPKAASRRHGRQQGAMTDPS